MCEAATLIDTGGVENRLYYHVLLPELLARRHVRRCQGACGTAAVAGSAGQRILLRKYWKASGRSVNSSRPPVLWCRISHTSAGVAKKNLASLAPR